jgi:hypothetical protein
MRIRLDHHARAAIEDFWALSQAVAIRPTRFAKLVPHRTPYTPLGACDASGQGMGGVWLPPATQPRSHNATQPWIPYPPIL